MLDSDTFDFSFSGLKTAVLRFTQTHQSSLPQSFLAANVQEAIVDVLVEKSFRAVQTYHPKSFLLSGGVAANALLRERITNRLSTLTSVFIPPPSLCTDNGACIAAAAYYHPVTLPWMELTANPQLSILS
jgi:N6-L-threonylcarbamoyladenine synthase